MPALAYLDGGPPQPDALDWLLTSRALAYGEGAFTTARIYQHQVIFLAAHLQRLQESLAGLSIPLDVVDWRLLEDEMRALARQQGEGMLKVMLLAGTGGRGYRRDDETQWHRYLHTHDLSGTLDAYQTGVSVWRLDALESSVATPYKHLNRLPQVLYSAQLPAAYPDAIVVNDGGEIAEGIARNLFWVEGSRCMTPPLASGALAGVMRRQLLKTHETRAEGIKVEETREQEQEVPCLKTVQSSINLPITEAPLTLARLLAADEVILVNALQGLWPVRSLNDAQGCLQQWSVGPVTRMLMKCWHPQMGWPVGINEGEPS
ncbi:hypothetical protein BFW38_04965 [Terasakiispira papahanaumokuakeensis]|uniref:Aminodeoxychorismate lyase n=1 Tax=Terasakiispira papahanaumokuakeensis TaxID=197479 RepID=A0A1E2V8L4_9GAMM|nr:aminotransferase class IV [Terasakiispira papahanaumokuakeensis]ODC02995.1 hypothetical protein BFW38_04965 [Terasakiispira papahanaumokuakeensis]